MAAAFVVIVRLLISAISFLIRRKKVQGPKKKAGTVLNCIFSVILIAVALVPSFIFANYNGLKTTGKYSINECSAILVDQSRKETYENDGSFREIPAHFYYPESNDGSFPLVIFSHGAFGYYQSNYSTYAELASNGYVVVSLDHPHHAFFTKDTDGKLITVDQDFINDAMRISNDSSVSCEEIYKVTKSWMQLRVDDGCFVIDTIKQAKDSNKLSNTWHTDDTERILSILDNTDTEKIGYIGHSLGGATGIALGRQRDDIDTVIDLDGTALGEITGVSDGKFVCDNTSYPVPALVFSQKLNYNENANEQERSILDINTNLVNNAKDAKYVEFSGAGHMDFTDLPLFSPFLGAMLGHGDIDSEECMTKVNSIVLNWFDYYLKNEGSLDIQARY